MPRGSVFCEILLGVVGVGEALQSVQDVREDERVNVPGPEEVEMLEMRDLCRDGVGWKLLEHHADIDQRIATAVDKDNWCLNIPRWETGDFRVLIDTVEQEGTLRIVVVQLEGFIANDLEPVNDALGAGEGVEMRIGGEFLGHGYVFAVPAEEEGKRCIDGADEYRRIQDGLPHCRGAEDGSTAKEKEEDLWGSFHEGVNNAVTQPCWRHGWCEGDEDVDFFV